MHCKSRTTPYKRLSSASTYKIHRTLPPGSQRQHFLSLATPEAVEAAKAKDPKMFEEAHYGMVGSPVLTYLASSVWTWAVCEQDEPRMFIFNDV